MLGAMLWCSKVNRCVVLWQSTNAVQCAYFSWKLKSVSMRTCRLFNTLPWLLTFWESFISTECGAVKMYSEQWTGLPIICRCRGIWRMACCGHIYANTGWMLRLLVRRIVWLFDANWNCIRYEFDVFIGFSIVHNSTQQSPCLLGTTILAEGARFIQP